MIGKASGKVLEGVASYESGKYTRSVMLANARNAEADTSAEIERLRTTARLAQGRQIGALGSGGLQFDGSALDAVLESQVESELETQAARRRGTLAAEGLRSQGRVAYATGYNGMIQGFAGAAAELAKGPASGGANYGG